MKNEHTIYALMRKRAELAGKLEHHQAVVRQTMVELDALDATLHMFAPDIELEEIRPKPLPPRAAAYKGEVARILLNTLRNADRPHNAHELTMLVMTERGLNTADKRLAKTVTKRVMSSLRHYRNKGVLQSSPGPGGLLAWEIVR